jgi:hypothetical protein
MESYKGSIIRSKRKQLQIQKVGKISTTETRIIPIMGDI